MHAPPSYNVVEGVSAEEQAGGGEIVEQILRPLHVLHRTGIMKWLWRDTDKCILFEIYTGIEPAIQIHLAYSIDTKAQS